MIKRRWYMFTPFELEARMPREGIVVQVVDVDTAKREYLTRIGNRIGYLRTIGGRDNLLEVGYVTGRPGRPYSYDEVAHYKAGRAMSNLRGAEEFTHAFATIVMEQLL